MEKDTLSITNDSPTSVELGQYAIDVQKNDLTVSEETDDEKFTAAENVDNISISGSKFQGDKLGDFVKHDEMSYGNRVIESKFEEGKLNDDIQQVGLGDKLDEGINSDCKPDEGKTQTTGEILGHKEEQKPNEMEVPGEEANRTVTSLQSTDAGPETEGSMWPEKAMVFRDFVKNKGAVAVTSFLRILSGRRDGVEQFPVDEEKEASDSAKDREAAEVSQKPEDRSAWNPLSYIMTSRNSDTENRAEHGVETIEELREPVVMKGRIILYTRLGCQNCKEVRLFLYNKRLRYVEINIDVYPSRKLELEKFTGSSAVPKLFFNEVVIGGLSELMGLDESGKLEEKIDYLITEPPAYEAPLPPLSGEDDVSTSGSFDELALIVRKMKESIVVKDRFYKMRRFGSCFLGSDAVDFLSEDQYLERVDAIEFGRKLASKLFFRHVLDENLFEDGNHLYWFLDDDPTVSSQCHNIPRGIIEAKPKPITEIASRLRFLFYAISEAYTSEDGKHIDYRTIHGSEEFHRYLRIIQELQRVEFQDIPREEKLSFFINLYNMMVIHAILVLGHPDGALERKKFFGDFKYVIGGCSYSLSAIQNGILRGNQRPPYGLMKPFSGNDKRCKVSLPYTEPLVHFALVNGTRSGPALQCYSPGNVDKELMDAARNFLRGGGLVVNVNAKVAYVSKILKWFSMDFGKNEVEVLKHASNYLEPANSEALLELLAQGQLKVQYQPYDWGLNL
ncbi:electron transporter, putative [Ricinus communis]|uniref:Electron transporter, putative n=1 Tax=Ricinus communis TaxID=3988 RepID=B9RJD7_RICCO|nr:electron transporter, putative [Ricinus communis]